MIKLALIDNGKVGKGKGTVKTADSYRKPRAISTEQRERVRQMTIERNKAKDD